ncbi:MAG: DNA repair protein RadA, partial [Gammaproteobacteria bacterium]
MPKEKLVYNCRECGTQVPKWSGQCPDCGAWNSLTEVVAATPSKVARFAGYTRSGNPVVVQRLSEVEPGKETRIPIGLEEVNRVLGGGLVAGSVVLIGGDPGIGKSTLLLQTVAQFGPSISTLYVTGEESPEQVSLRGVRLGLSCERVSVLAETSVENILAAAGREQPQVMVIDSIQTLYTDWLQSAPGSVAQVRESAAQLVRYAKQTRTALFLIGHVTKEGTLAGPRVLEHMVDTVLYFEGDLGSRYRVVRAVKNRFGAVNEIGVFAMTDKGLREVSNPSAIFLSRHEQPVSGSVIMVTREGTRPLLVEVQALLDQSHMVSP